MIDPFRLIGMKYRLGADPEKHGAADCLSLTRHVVANYGVTMPTAERSWYRRLRRKDYSVFPEQLMAWGEPIKNPRIGSVVLCKNETGFALGAYWSGGCLVFTGNEVSWRPITALAIEQFYFPLKQNCVTPFE